MKPFQPKIMRLLFLAMLGFAFSRHALGLSAVKSITLSGDGGEAALKVSLSAPSSPKIEYLGRKILVKVPGASAGAMKAPSGAGPVKDLRLGDHKDGLWIVADMGAASGASVKNEGSSFTVTFKAKGAKPAAAAKGAVPGAAPEADKAEAEDTQLQSLAPSSSQQTARIVDVSLGEIGGESQVVVSSDAPVSYKPAVSEGGKKISVTFKGASLSWAATDIAGNDPSLQSLKARQISVRGESQVVIELALKEKVPYTITRDQNQVMINLGRSSAAKAAKAQGTLDMSISVDFESADMLGVLRNIADQAGFETKLGTSILALTDAARLVSYSANNRPLREVLFGILSQKGLTFKVQGNTMYFGADADFVALKLGTPVTTKFYLPRNQTKVVLEKLVNNVYWEAGESGATMQDDPTDPEKIMVTGFESDVATTMKYLRRWDVPYTGEAAAAEDSSAGDEEAGGRAKKTKVYSLKYIDSSTSSLLTAGITQVIPADVLAGGGFVYNFDPGTRKLLVTSKLKYIKIIDRLLEHIDVRIPQVHIEGKIITVSQNDAKSLGINWSYAQRQGTQNASLRFIAPQGGAAVATFGDTQALSQLNATLDALVTKDLANVISSPSLTTKDGVAATIAGTDSIVVQKATVTSNASGTTTTFEFTTQSVPINLGVTPKISQEEGKVEMLVNFTLSSVVGESTGGGAPAPLTTQSIQTTVMVSNGETAVIGGLTRDSWVKGMSGVPILSDIPLLGLLFKGERVRKVKSDVIIFITPTIVED